MSLSVIYNGVQLNQYINVLRGFSPRIGVTWDPATRDGANMKNGADFVYTSYKQKTIEMPFTIEGNVETKYNSLMKALRTKEPQRLEFGNVPGKYYNAIPSGDLSIDEVLEYGRGTINWYIPEGVAYSTVTKKTFENATEIVDDDGNHSGVYELEIVNNGTEAAPISYEITHSTDTEGGENGFVGIVSDAGVLQYGDANETDLGVEEYSVMMINNDTADKVLQMAEVTGMHWGGAEYPTNGTWKKATWYSKEYVVPNSYGSESGWHGACKTAALSEKLEHFRCENVLYFQNYSGHAVGAYELTIADENLNRICCVWVYNPTTKWVDWFETDIEVNQKTKATGQWIKKTASPYEYNLVVDKKGGTVTIDVAGKRFSYYDAALVGKKAKYISISILVKGTQGPAWMGIKSFKFRKDKLERIVDIPNRYQPGCKMVVDGETTKMFVDGINATEDEAVGSVHFKAEPGTTKVQFVTSDFCTSKPTFKAWIHERFL